MTISDFQGWMFCLIHVHIHNSSNSVLLCAYVLVLDWQSYVLFVWNVCIGKKVLVFPKLIHICAQCTYINNVQRNLQKEYGFCTIHAQNAKWKCLSTCDYLVNSNRWFCHLTDELSDPLVLPAQAFVYITKNWIDD